MSSMRRTSRTRTPRRRQDAAGGENTREAGDAIVMAAIILVSMDRTSREAGCCCGSNQRDLSDRYRNNATNWGIMLSRTAADQITTNGSMLLKYLAYGTELKVTHCCNTHAFCTLFRTYASPALPSSCHLTAPVFVPPLIPHPGQALAAARRHRAPARARAPLQPRLHLAAAPAHGALVLQAAAQDQLPHLGEGEGLYHAVKPISQSAQGKQTAALLGVLPPAAAAACSRASA